MTLIRFFGNLFTSPEGREGADQNFSSIQDFVTTTLTGIGQGDRNCLVAAATLWINYAVLFASKGAEQVFDPALAILTALKETVLDRAAASDEKDGEVVFRGLVAVGTMLGVGGEIRVAGRDVVGLGPGVGRIAGAFAEKRDRDLAVEVKGLVS